MSKEKKPKHVRRWFNEFKEFAMRGNVIDLAVGIIIGGAFGKITTSLVNDVFMPIVGMLFGGVNFDSLVIILPPTPLGEKDPVTLNLGRFISTIVDFVLIAVCVFLFIKLISALRRKEKPEPPKEPETPPELILLTEIRDLLRERADRKTE